MKIRNYTPADRNKCIEIFNSNTPQYFDPSEQKPFELWLSGRDENRIAYKTRGEFYFVAEEEGTVIGCGGFYIFNERDAANMAWGMVAKSHHKKGVGMQLLKYRFNVIRELYPDYEIVLDTSQHTFPFFQKAGFEVVKITENAYGVGLHRHDMVLKPN